MRPGLLPVMMSAAALLLGSGNVPLSANEVADATARTEATARLESLGLAHNDSSFVRVVAASHRPAIDLFFKAGADVNAVGERGRSALLAAVLARDWATTNRLLEAGADVQKADEQGLTPLMAAALAGHLPTVEKLIEKTANPLAVDANGHTALHFAIAAHKREIIERLLQTKPSFADQCCESKDLLGHALETHDPQIIEPVLAQVPTLEQWSAQAAEALQAALRAKDYKFAKLLISRHTVAPAPAPGAQPLLAYAIARGDTEQLKTLLECGVNPNSPLDAKGDAAFVALMGKNFVRHYLPKEAGITPLMVAAGMGRKDLVKLLLDGGADRLQSTRSRSRLLPLYFAAWAESPETIQLLLAGTPPSRDELRVEVNLTKQRATLLRYGLEVFSTAISSGTRNKPTPTGEFVITDKNRHHRSSIYNNAPMPYFMRLSCRDFGLHQGYVTGRPASHGCIRLPEAAASKLFSELPVGTWVSVFH